MDLLRARALLMVPMVVVVEGRDRGVGGRPDNVDGSSNFSQQQARGVQRRPNWNGDGQE